MWHNLLYRSLYWRDRAGIILLGLLLFLPFLGSTQLWDFDEAYFGAIAQEMANHHAWIVPTYNDGELGDKPILLFWGIRISFLIFGENEFAARFPSVLWSIGTLLVIYQIGLRLFSRDVAIRAVIILATSLMFCLESRAVTTDAALMFLFTSIIAVYICGVYQPRSIEEIDKKTVPALRAEGVFFPQAWQQVYLFYALLGIAVLCKGPVFFILPMATLGLFSLLKGAPARTTRIAKIFAPFYPQNWLRALREMNLARGILIVLAVAAPWYLLVGVWTQGAWWELFFWKHNFSRAMNVMHGARGGVYYYPLALLFGTFPWSIFFIPACIHLVRRAWRGTPFADGLLLMLCWSGIVMTAFSCAATKFPSYIAPMFPAAAILYATFFAAWKKEKEQTAKWWTPVSFGTLGIIGILLIIGVLVAIPLYAGTFITGEAILSLLGVFVLATAIFAGVIIYRAQNKAPQKIKTHQHLEYLLWSFAIGFMSLFFFWGAPRVSQHMRYQELLAHIPQDAHSQNESIAAIQCLEPSWVFYHGKPIRKIDKNSFEEKLQAKEFLMAHFFLMRSTDYENLRNKCKQNELFEIARVPYFGRPYDLILLLWNQPTFIDTTPPTTNPLLGNSFPPYPPHYFPITTPLETQNAIPEPSPPVAE